MSKKILTILLAGAILAGPFLASLSNGSSDVMAAGCSGFSDNYNGSFQEQYDPWLGLAPAINNNRMRLSADSDSNVNAYILSVKSFEGDVTTTIYVADLPMPGTGSPDVRASLGLANPTLAGFSTSYERISGGQSRVSFFVGLLGDSPYEVSANITDRSNIYLRVRRQGNVFTGLYSTDGSNFIQIGSRTVAFQYPLNISFSHGIDTATSGVSSYADFDNASLVCSADSSIEVPVYRFLNKKKTSHFYTMDKAERDNLIANNSANWKYEGEAFKANTGSLAGYAPVYRFYSAAYNSHFYTMDAGEKNTLIATNKNWSYQGIAYYAKTSAGSGFAPVYRFYSANYKAHFWTKDVNEKNAILAGNPNWKYEGVGYYAK